ncbi:hydrogenase iron-sulfur subunit [Chloroflexota bacterium]
MSGENEARVGVLICDCGKEIASVLDTNELCQQVSAFPGVVYTNVEAYPCSKDGRARLSGAIESNGLDRVLIAGCAPRLVKKLFQGTAEAVGLNPDYLDVVNIREGCAYVHRDDVEAALQKAVDLAAMGVGRLTNIKPKQIIVGKVEKSALVIGSGLSGLASALLLAQDDIPVTLVESEDQLGGKLVQLQADCDELIIEQIAAVKEHPGINLMLQTRVTQVSGSPGNYQVRISNADGNFDLNVGAVLIAGGAQPNKKNGHTRFDGQVVKTLTEFEEELKSSSELEHQNLVFILYEGDDHSGKSTPLNSRASLRQAIQAKQRNPETNVTVLFRDLLLGTAGGKGEEDFLWAKDLGITFFRYFQESPPEIGGQVVAVHNPMINDTLEIPYDRVVASMPISPPRQADSLARLFHIPQDDQGFLIDRRMPLRPEHGFDDGIYVLGSAHLPVDTTETMFQAYLISDRASRFLSQEMISVSASFAEIDSDLCTGCGNCVQVCMAEAIYLEKRSGVLSLAEINALQCTGCGNCVVACPVKAITIPGWNDQAIMAQIDAALGGPAMVDPAEDVFSQKRILALTCEWSAYAAAEVAGARQLPYDADVRVIPMNCSARFDPDHILWALLNGADGILLGACHANDCHYGIGSLYARERFEKLQKQFQYFGINPKRIKLEFISGDDGQKFIDALSDFSEQLEKSERALSK